LDWIERRAFKKNKTNHISAFDSGRNSEMKTIKQHHKLISIEVLPPIKLKDNFESIETKVVEC
jgi:hypothetical protein